MRRTLLLAFLLTAARIDAQVLTTEVWLGKLDLSGGVLRVSDLRNISNHPGYDNQPSFFPDGASLLYTTEAESVAETGLGVHAVRYWLADGRAVPLPRARGFSPTPTADGTAFMTLREGTVWLHDLDGNPQGSLLPLVKTAGYFTQMDEHRWVLFMNEPTRRITHWDGARFAMADIAQWAVTGLYRIPGTMSVTYVVEPENQPKTLKRLDLTEDRGTMDRELATIPFRTGGHHVWTSRGTLLMASGNAIHEWDPDFPESWPIVHRFDEPGLQGISRIAISPDETWIALVSTPDDATVLRESRDAANAAFAEAVARHRGVSWTRKTESWDLAGDTARERGTSVRRWPGSSGPQELRTSYTVTWRKTIGGNGVPAWAPVSEQYTTIP